MPGCVHLDLQRNGLIPDPFWGENEKLLHWIEEEDWTYATTFTAPAAKRVFLVADGLDTLATVTLNGRRVAQTENMFLGYRFDVTRQLRPGRNELVILFGSPMRYIRQRLRPDHCREWNDPVGGASLIRKQQCSFGWDWGPRFPTCGIYRPIRLETSVTPDIRIRQIHRDGRVVLRLNAKHARLSFRGRLVAEGSDTLIVREPRLWWPNDLGDQPLYDLVADGQHRRIGLRTVRLDRHRDKWGESFQFMVNGVPVFAKGANWIPAHSFVAALKRKDYDDLLASAAEANMNMLRVWGGGIYESDDFYDLCDEKGLLVWQDFMFACALYSPSRQIEQEAAYQVKRLHHHACLALWCGNNELEQMPQEILKTKRRQRAFEKIFYDILPAAVEKHDGVTPYWPGSPHNPEGYKRGFNSERAGDFHFWDVWHTRKPVKRYEEIHPRFCSEFGMQSYCSPEVARRFCDELNVFAPAMENHQKNSAGNQIIADYVSRRYRYPKDYAALAYLSQLNQAYCMKVGVEHFRRSMPRTMGALYWQLNDCWPVASWSSIEFGGNWKVLHYAARRFFAPALVSAHVPGEERLGLGNEVVSTIRDVHLYTVYDAPEPAQGEVGWELWRLSDNRVLERGRKPVWLRYGEVVLQKKLDFAEALHRHGARDLCLRIWLRVNGRAASEDTVFFTAPRFMEFQRAPIRVEILRVAKQEARLVFRSAEFQHAVWFGFKGLRYRASDNGFDLYPGRVKAVQVHWEETRKSAALRKRLNVISLASSYQ